MTTEYTIHSPTTGRTLKASYRGGNFFRLETVSGPRTETVQELVNMAKVTPLKEADVEKYQAAWPKLQYTKVEKEKSILGQYTDAWFAFCYERDGYPPKFTGADGLALKRLTVYLKKVSGSDAEGIALFRLLLQNWSSLEEFHKRNADIKYIESKINVLLNGIKRATQAGTGGADHSVRL